MKIILVDFKKSSWKNNIRGKQNCASDLFRSSAFFVFNPGRYEERARLAPCGFARRQPQDVQHDLERNFDGS